MHTTALRARLVLPMDGPPIEGGYVTVVGEQIADVGRKPPGGAAVEDLGDVALLPGLVNAHTHFEFSGLAERLGKPGMDFVDWIRLVIARRSSDAADPASAIAQGRRESLAAGVTTVCDITTADARIYADAASGPDIVPLLEVIGFSRARAESAFASLVERLRISCQVARAMPHVLSIGISPHAPYTVGPDLVRRLLEQAGADKLLTGMHLAESRAELELLASGGGAFRDLLIERSMWDEAALRGYRRPYGYLLDLARAPRVLVVHGTHLTADERQLLAGQRDRMTLVYCPRTHAYFNASPFPLADVLHEGVRVVLGTDSRASNPDLSVLNEARYVFRHHPRVAPEQVLRMATVDAAHALGIADRVGSITPGKIASLTAVPLEGHAHPAPERWVLAGNAPPVATWYRGRLTDSAECTG